MPDSAELLYALAWLTFGAGHSLLAGVRVKAWLGPLLGRSYRLAYNLFAGLHFALIAWVGVLLLGVLPAFELPTPVKAGLLVMHLAGWAGLLWSMRYYDGARLLGLTQLLHPERPEDEPLRSDGPHRCVRHPLYAFAFLVLWGAAINPLGLATAIWASLYLVIGSRFEERRLLGLYGEDYARYRQRVPAFLPWKGRCWP